MVECVAFLIISFFLLLLGRAAADFPEVFRLFPESPSEDILSSAPRPIPRHPFESRLNSPVNGPNALNPTNPHFQSKNFPLQTASLMQRWPSYDSKSDLLINENPISDRELVDSRHFSKLQTLELGLKTSQEPVQSQFESIERNKRRFKSLRTIPDEFDDEAGKRKTITLFGKKIIVNEGDEQKQDNALESWILNNRKSSQSLSHSYKSETDSAQSIAPQNSLEYAFSSGDFPVHHRLGLSAVASPASSSSFESTQNNLQAIHNAALGFSTEVTSELSHQNNKLRDNYQKPLFIHSESPFFPTTTKKKSSQEPSIHSSVASNSKELWDMEKQEKRRQFDVRGDFLEKRSSLEQFVFHCIEALDLKLDGYTPKIFVIFGKLRLTSQDRPMKLRISKARKFFQKFQALSAQFQTDPMELMGSVKMLKELLRSELERIGESSKNVYQDFQEYFSGIRAITPIKMLDSRSAEHSSLLLLQNLITMRKLVLLADPEGESGAEINIGLEFQWLKEFWNDYYFNPNDAWNSRSLQKYQVLKKIIQEISQISATYNQDFHYKGDQSVQVYSIYQNLLSNRLLRIAAPDFRERNWLSASSLEGAKKFLWNCQMAELKHEL